LKNNGQKIFEKFCPRKILKNNGRKKLIKLKENLSTRPYTASQSADNNFFSFCENAQKTRKMHMGHETLHPKKHQQ